MDIEKKGLAYDAFISYRHKPLDTAAANRLQSLLEKYRPPRPYHNQRIRRVFIDRGELPLTGDLREDIRASLEASRYLIVIASPDYLESEYCKAELAYFLARFDGATHHVLTVLTRGAPSESISPALFRLPEEVSQPQFLRQVEPLYCDARAPSVRQSLRKLNQEFLRVAAPILGLGYDTLYRRDARRQRQRRAAAAAFTAAAILFLAGFWYTMDQRVLREKQSAYSAKVMTLAGQARAALAADDDLLALLYAAASVLESESGRGQGGMIPPEEAESALQSAHLQRELKRLSLPLPKTAAAAYGYYDAAYSTDQYYIPQANAILINDSMLTAPTKLIDLKNGAALADGLYARFNLTRDSHYLLSFDAALSQEGVPTEYVQIDDLFAQRRLLRAPLRPLEKDSAEVAFEYAETGPFLFYGGGFAASRNAYASGATSVYTAADASGGAAFLAAFDAKGNRLTYGAAKALLEAAGGERAPIQKAETPRFTVKLAGGKRTVRTAQGADVFTIPSGALYSLSYDAHKLAVAQSASREIQLYETDGWTQLTSLVWPETENLLALDLTRDGAFAVLLLRRTDAVPGADENFVRILETDSGAVLYTSAGRAILDETAERLLLCDHGALSVLEIHPENRPPEAASVSESAADAAALPALRETDAYAITLDETAMANDLTIVRKSDGASLFRAGECTAAFDFSADSGYLVRQLCSYRRNPTETLQVLRLDEAAAQARVTLQMQHIDARFKLDSTGRYLSVWHPSGSQVYDLDSGKCVAQMWGVEALYDNGAMAAAHWPLDGPDARRVPLLNQADLLLYAKDALTSPFGERTLAE